MSVKAAEVIQYWPGIVRRGPLRFKVVLKITFGSIWASKEIDLHRATHFYLLAGYGRRFAVLARDEREIHQLLEIV